ncbi:MAG TPA: hypothetical protein VFD82_06025 [Planctomycetota bacterium]|nr:hypothetical protein [Planctomycetota bacterium]
MNPLLSSLCVVSALTAAATAQCFESNYGVLAGYGDDVLFTPQPMNITFPMAGVAASYTHAHISTNGVFWLTTGAAGIGSTISGYPSLATYLGTAGQSARIAPMWMDLDHLPANGGGVFYNNTIPGKFVVTWANAEEWGTQATTPTFTVQAQLFANGDVIFFYNSSTYGASYVNQLQLRCGLSEGNGVANPGSVDLSAGNINLTSFVMYEQFPLNVWDLQGTSVTFLYGGTGYIQTASACTPAYHESYGSGCYDISDSFYQFIPTATTAPAILNGQSMVMTPAGSNYSVVWGGATYVPPTGASTITLTDDSEAAQPISAPFPTPAGPVSTLYVGSNGIVSVAANSSALSYTPYAPTFLNAPVMAWWSWHDYNPAEPGSGQVKYHEATVGPNTIAYITFDGVESYSTPAGPNPSTLQFQFNLTTGDVAIVWVTIDGNPTSAFGSAHLIGWSPGGPSSDEGSINLATALPFVTQSANIFAMNLSATPSPVSTATSGTLLTYTTTNMIEYAPSSGVYVGLNILSVAQVPGGIPLAILGAPGCNAYVGSLDLLQAMVGVTSTNSVTFPLPAGVPQGFQLFSQSVGLITPFSLPNGQNAAGWIVSNGLKSYISVF